MQHGELNSREHNSVGVYAKKVLTYGWDSDAMAPVKIRSSEKGELYIRGLEQNAVYGTVPVAANSTAVVCVINVMNPISITGLLFSSNTEGSFDLIIDGQLIQRFWISSAQLSSSIPLEFPVDDVVVAVQFTNPKSITMKASATILYR